AGAVVAATTHYAELKTFATEHADVTNASVEFDVASLRPTYRLTTGLPGKSQAFAIAERLGLPSDVLADAQRRLSAEHLSMEETLAAIQRAEQARGEELDQAREERVAAEVAQSTGQSSGDEADGAARPEPRVGLFARSRTLGTTGRIVDRSGRTGRVTLETEGARVVVPSDDVEVVPEPVSAPPSTDRAAEELRRRAAARISPRLDLRGERVEAALEQLDAYLDEALLAELDSVAIIHGAGTGRFRRATRGRPAEPPR